MKFDHNHYVPCLRWKQGEYQAVVRLLPVTKRALTPLIEVPEVGWDFETETHAKTLDEHLAKFASHVQAKWGRRTCLVDGRLLPPAGTMATGLHAMCAIFDALRSQQCLAVPVTGPERAPQYQSAIRQIVAKDGRGVCIRIPLERALGATVSTNVNSLLAEMGLRHSDSHLVLDLGAPPNFDPIPGFAKLVQKATEGLPHLRRWRTFTLLGTSFLKTMGDVKASPTILPRSEWLLYKQVLVGFQEVGLRLPSFGDYAVQHPDVWRMDMRKVKPAASIRYSADDIWFILKGSNVRDNGYEQYRKMCRELVSSPHFSGADCSYGDKYIADCAKGTGKTGNLSMWRCVGTNHHLEKVVRDVSNLFGSSAAS